MVKLWFLLGLARRITETIGVIAFPQVVETLGRLSSQLQAIDASVYAMEAKGWRYGEFTCPTGSCSTHRRCSRRRCVRKSCRPSASSRAGR